MKTKASTLTAIVALVFAASAAAFTDNPVLDRIATLSAGVAAQIRCDSQQEWITDPAIVGAQKALGYEPGGYHPDGASYAIVNPADCGFAIQTVTDPKGNPKLGTYRPLAAREGVAIFLILHEAGHIGGLVNEHDTDCHALAVMPKALQMLKVPAARAKIMEQSAAAFHANETGAYAGPC